MFSYFPCRLRPITPIGSFASTRCLLLIGLLLTGLGLAAASRANAQVPDTLLHSFGDGTVANDGTLPNDLTLGKDGNFYGTCFDGGSTQTAGDLSSGYGTAFKMTPSGIVTILHNFGDGSVANDGAGPNDLVQGADGSFYGTTQYGGSTQTAGNPASGYGMAFKMTAAGVVTIMHSFGDGSVVNDGHAPSGALVQGRDNNFYGVCYEGGSTFTPGQPYSGNGTVFKITLSGTEIVLHNFDDGTVTNDGYGPTTALVVGTDGNFYGVCQGGGSLNYGAAYKVTPAGAVTILHDFGVGVGQVDGVYPSAPLTLGTDGNFYGVCFDGGSTENADPNGIGYGTIFKMTPSGTETTIHNCGDGTVANDGIYPYATLTRGADGNFYGTNEAGGANNNGNGTVFKITPSGTETILHSFRDGTVANDAAGSSDTVIFGADGNLYGTSVGGGATTATDPNHNGYGAAYRLTVSTGTQPATITSLSPNTCQAGRYPFTLIVNGTGFVSSALVKWNGTALTTTFVSATQLTASISASLVRTAGTANVTVINSGAAASNTLAFAITAAPTLTTLSPPSVQAGRYAFTLTVNGTNFVNGAVVDWNGTALTTTFISANQLTAPVTASLVKTAGTASITVANPHVTATLPLTETITAPPTLTNLSPSSARAGTAAFTITVNGTNFVSGATVDWNGSPRTTTFVTATKLTAVVHASDVATAGTASVTVANPHVTPTNAAAFTILAH